MIDSLHKYPVFPDLLENQKRSLQYFWKKGILEELELFSYLSRSNTEDFHEIQNREGRQRKNSTSLFSFLSRGVRSLHSKSVFQFEKQNKTQKRSPNTIVLFNQLSFHQLKETQPQFFSMKNSGGQQSIPSLLGRVGTKAKFFNQNFSNSSSTKSKLQNLRPLKFSFGSSVFKDFHESLSIHDQKETYFKPEFFPNKDDTDSGKNSKIIIHGSKFLLKTPQYSKQQAIRGQKTYSVGLYIPVELVENFGSSRTGLSNSQDLDFFVKNGETRTLFQTKDHSSTKNSENSKVFAFSNVCNPKDGFSFLGTSSSILGSSISFSNQVFGNSESLEKNKNNPRHVVGGLGFPSLTQDSSTSDIFGQTSARKDHFIEAKPWAESEESLLRREDSVQKQSFCSEAFVPSLDVKTKFSHQGSPALPGFLPGKAGIPLFIDSSPKLTSQLDQNFKPRWFYFGDIPLMTERGSFLINGAPRVLVNQIIRCPSVYFKLKLDSKNRRSFIASFLSEYGSWLRLETDRLRSRIWVRIDKSPRFPLDWLLSALGWSSEKDSLKNYDGFPEDFESGTSSLIQGIQKKNPFLGSPKTSLKFGSKILKNNKNGDSSLIGVGERFGKNESTHQEATQLIWKKCNPSRWTSFIGCYSFFYTKFFHPRRYSLGNLGRLSLNKRLGRRGDCEIPTLTPEDIFLALDYLIQLQNGNESGKFYLDDIDHLKNRRVRLPGEIIQNQFRLALSRLSGVVFNSLNSRTKAQGISTETKFPSQGIEVSIPTFNRLNLEKETLSSDSGTKSTIQGIPASPGRNPGFAGKPWVENSVFNPRLDLKTEFSIQGSTIAQIFGGSPPQSFVSTLRELFNTSQLSQYMDQTNPLAEITHKRRLTSLGPGGVGRDQAGFAVREIHPSHFGRICPIETPEGQNAGLVGSLASYARINADGFLQSPAMSLFSSTSAFNLGKETDLISKEIPAQPGRLGAVTKSPHQGIAKNPIYLFSAEAEDEIYLCTADIGAVTTRSRIRSFEKDEPVPIRFKQEFIATSGKKIQYTGICPIQMISVATSLIPFLEHDDANRALMGSNMQRQAVPLVFPEKAFVGTGLEMQAARDSSTPLISSVSGQVHFVDASRIEIRHESNQLKSFDLLTYARSNQSTSIHHRPAVQLNEWVEKGDILADGSATHDGELSLGKNLLLAYMPWEGYNFEDAIVINERLVYEDVYTSLHVERYEVDIRNAQPLRLGLDFLPEEGLDKQSFSQFQKNSNSIPFFESSAFESSFLGQAGILENNPQTEMASLVGNFDVKASLSNQTKDQSGTDFSQDLEGESPRIEKPSFESKQSFNSKPSETKSLNQINSKQNLTMMEIGKEYITRDLDLVFGGRSVSRSSDSFADQSSDLSQVENPEMLGEPARLESVTKALSQERSPSENRNFSSQICNLDPEGIIQPGTWVKEGDILVGKITPMQRTKISSGQSPPEYRLLVAIFADGASKIESSFNIRFKNTSFKAGIGVKGRVIDCIIPWRPSNSLSRSNSLNLPQSNNRQIRKSAPIQIFLAHKKRIQLGDKMSGRHGNKGIVSLILPPHDMPYTQDGKPIDVVLNPLGVPSRMNVGQVLESLLGLVSVANNQIYRLMPFDEMYGGNNPSPQPECEKNIERLSRPETSRSIVYSKLQTTRNLLGKAAEWYFDPNNPGKTQIFDGRTGEVFHQPALVGYSYMFKLIHLVDDKIHARSTGPYSLVTQQPLGGRSKKGGQRLGEMEVWALEGFGAAYILQEFLTVKSDEIYSRNTFLLDLMKRKTEESKTSLIPTSRFESFVPESSLSIGESDTAESLLHSLENKLGTGTKFPNQLLEAELQELGILNDSKKTKKQNGLTFDLLESSRVGKKLRSTNESRVPESFRVLVNELQALCLSVYYNPDFRLSYPSLLGWDGVFLLASKKFPTSPELSQIKNIGF